MAGRIRTIKPELLEDERVAALSSNAFRLFVGCILRADDYGNLRIAVGALAGAVFWLLIEQGKVTILDVEAARAELLAPGPIDPVTQRRRPGLLTAYRVHGQVYAHITGWEKHQRVDRPGPAHAPPMTDGSIIAVYSGRVQDIREAFASDPRGVRERPATDLDLDQDQDHDQDHDQEDPGSAGSEPSGSGSAPSERTSLPTAGAHKAQQARPSEPRSFPAAQTTLLPTEASRPREPSLAERVFAVYVEGWSRLVHGTRPPKLDDKRRKLILSRSREFPIDDLLNAVRGIWSSEWNVAHRQTSIELCLRDAAHIEKFRDIALCPELGRDRSAPRHGGTMVQQPGKQQLWEEAEGTPA